MGLMEVLVCIGLLTIAIAYWKDREILRIDLKAIQNFITLMALLAMARLVIFSLLYDFIGLKITDLNSAVNTIPLWVLSTVFWEDAFFGITIYYLIDKFKTPKYIWLPAVSALSILFAVHHMYQFELAYFSTILIPFFIFYTLGKKYGFGTTMVCHIIFDISGFLTFKLASMVLYN